LKVIVIQLGARHRYAVPRFLFEAKHLEALYTDSNATFGVGRLFNHLPQSMLSRSAKRLIQRRISGIPSSLVRSTDLLLLYEPLLRRTSTSEFDFNLRRDRVFSRALQKWGPGNATWIYSMFGEGWNFIESAKKRDIRIALDMFVNPITHRIVENERRLFPDWELPDAENFQALENDLCKRIALADLLLCPAQSVVEGLKSYPTFDAEKVRVVPYGFAVDARPKGASPIPRRILFGGAANLRKGIHYLARAATLLSSSFPGYEFRVAGPVTNTVRSKTECRNLNFLGPLSRADFLAELELADIFVLPTLAEGSATVIYEALSFGIPVVTTMSAGSVITSGKEGLIVPERDAAALATAIREITELRTVRDSMSIEAAFTAKEFSEELWGKRLIAALQSAA
jgi:glycosyltransferase involved in cell wall biosynthesis